MFGSAFLAPIRIIATIFSFAGGLLFAFGNIKSLVELFGSLADIAKLLIVLITCCCPSKNKNKKGKDERKGKSSKERDDGGVSENSSSSDSDPDEGNYESNVPVVNLKKSVEDEMISDIKNNNKSSSSRNSYSKKIQEKKQRLTRRQESVAIVKSAVNGGFWIVGILSGILMVAQIASVGFSFLYGLSSAYHESEYAYKTALKKDLDCKKLDSELMKTFEKECLEALLYVKTPNFPYWGTVLNITKSGIHTCGFFSCSDFVNHIGVASKQGLKLIATGIGLGLTTFLFAILLFAVVYPFFKRSVNDEEETENENEEDKEELIIVEKEDESKVTLRTRRVGKANTPTHFNKEEDIKTK